MPETCDTSKLTVLKSCLLCNVFSLGDLSGHKMWTDYAGPGRVLDNIASVSKQMHSRFSKIPIFPMIGNNDLPGHYVLPNSSNDWYQRLLTSWAPLILCSDCPGDVHKPTTKAVLQESFLQGGYYNASIAGNCLEFIISYLIQLCLVIIRRVGITLLYKLCCIKLCRSPIPN